MPKKPASNSFKTRSQLLQALFLNHPRHFRCHHIAGIWLGRRLVSVGYNQRKTHPLQAKHGKNSWALYLHAEVDAIKNFLKTQSVSDLRRAKMIVIRDDMSNSEPCVGCKRAIANFEIRKVEWT